MKQKKSSFAPCFFILIAYVVHQNFQLCFSFKMRKSLDLNPTSGVYQINQIAHPIKVVDQGEGHIWNIPDTPEGINGFADASPKNNPDVTLPGYGGTNLQYGSTTTIGGNKLQEVPSVPKVIYGPPPALEVVETVNGKVVTVSEESVAKMYEPPKAPAATTPPSQYMPEVQSVPPSPPMAGMPPTPPPYFNPEPSNPNPGSAREMAAMGAAMGTALGAFNTNMNANSMLPGMPPIPMLAVPNMSKMLKTVAKQSAVDKQIMDQAPLKDTVCTRDYSKQCPAGWEPLDDMHCRAPTDYSGACPHMLKTEPMNAQEKSKLATECKFHWRCINDSCDKLEGINYSAPCPEKWAFTGECEAPANYEGHCNPRQNLSGLTTEQKELFASTCQATWPCKKRACERDYTKPCPELWIFNPETDTCSAPQEYEGYCYVTPVGISQMTPMRREAFEAECGVLWPCKSMKCKPDYANFACPEGWENVMQSNACLAPEEYEAKAGCPQLTHFDFFTEDEKAVFASRCNVHWPCVGSVEKDFSGCPAQWKEITSEGQYKGWCEPPAYYHGPCAEKQDIKSMTQGEKESFAIMCEIEFGPLSKTGPKNLKGKYDGSRLLVGTAVTEGPTLE